jgi:hypothetical protein
VTKSIQSDLSVNISLSLIELADEKSSFGDALRMKGAQCKINKAGLLIEACNLIDQMKIAEQNQDLQGDLYEYMLGHMQFAPFGDLRRGAVARAVVAKSPKGEPSRDIECLRGRISAFEPRSPRGRWRGCLSPF